MWWCLLVIGLPWLPTSLLYLFVLVIDYRKERRKIKWKRTVFPKPIQLTLAEHVRGLTLQASYIYIPIVFICDVICESIMKRFHYIVALHTATCILHTTHTHTHTSTLTFNANSLCNSLNAITKCLTKWK